MLYSDHKQSLPPAKCQPVTKALTRPWSSSSLVVVAAAVLVARFGVAAVAVATVVFVVAVVVHLLFNKKTAWVAITEASPSKPSLL